MQDANDDSLQQAIALHRSGRLSDAEAIYRQILTVDPDHADALQLLGAVAHQLGQHGVAIELIERSLALAPANKLALNNLGEAFRAVGKIDRSIQSFRRALELDPAYVKAHSNLLHTLHFDPASTGESLRREHEDWGRRHAPDTAPRPPRRRRREKILRVGYVSPDFKQHSVAYFIEPVIRHHNRHRVRVVCYANAAREDDVTARIRSSADEWRDITKLNDDQAAELVRRDEIDILIDLAGHMARNRLLLFARRPAAIQATWLGYPNGVGMRQIDFRISDPAADPPGMTDDHSIERLIRLPHSAWLYEPPETSPQIRARDPNHPITFGSFNKFPKISPITMNLWSQILAAVPSSRLLVKAKSLGDPSVRAIARQLLDSHGIALDRVEITGWSETSVDHLDRYNEIDIALDTFPYHGTTTTCEALWMGVPVVTLAGDKHVSRAGASLLHSAGLDDLIATTPQQYVHAAVTLAQSPDRRQLLQQSLRGTMNRSPLMDAAPFVAALEDAYQLMAATTF